MRAKIADRTRKDDGRAFLGDPYDKTRPAPARADEDLAEELAEEFLTSATLAEPVAEDRRDAVHEEEIGGPFVETEGSEEFASDVDEMNPPDAAREPFPTANGTRR